MDIMELGAIGELVGGVAVIASLLYVGIQIRQNTALTRAATMSDALNQSGEFSQAVALDKATSALFFKGVDDPDSLDRDEKSQFFFVMMAFMRRYENSEYQLRQGLLPEDGWSGFRNNLASIAPRPGFSWWWARAEAGFTEEFRTLVNQARDRSSDSQVNDLGRD